MKKFISNRVKVTKRGKLLRRAMGQSHCLAKKKTVQIKRKKAFRELGIGKKIIKKSI